MLHKIESKRAQIAIFVIIGLIIVVGIVFVFLLVKQPFTKFSPVENPTGYIDNCIKEPTLEAIEQISMHGGYIQAEEPSILYENEEVAYLCYTTDNEKLCTAIEPMLIEKIEDEIKEYITQPLEGCFKSLEQGLKLYNPQSSATQFEVEIMPKQILIEIDKDISYTKDEQTQKIDVFDVAIPSPMYEFTRITNNIINEEVDCNCGTETCNADVFTVAKTHDFEVERFVTGGNEKIYNLREIVTGDEFKFAIRNCVRLPY